MKGMFTANKNYILREIAGETILVSVGEEIADFCGVVTLNASAKALWQALQEEATEEDLVRVLVEKFDVSTEQARKDVEAALEMMQKSGLIKHVEA